MAENPDAAAKLKKLKNELRASGWPVRENYPCRWDEGEKHIVDLEVFGQRVLEDLWQGICVEYPEGAPEGDPVVVERQMHEAFVEERSRLHIGRETQLRRLTEYVQGTDRRPIVITGESGCGKSAFLATWYRRYAADHPQDYVLAYFVGASPDSTNHLRLLRNMCGELKRAFNLKEEIPGDDKKLSETLASVLAAASRDKSRIILVVDALDQLSAQDGAHGLGWLLDYMPERVRLVVSSLEGDCLEVFKRRDAEQIVLPLLNVDEQRQIVQIVLGEWRRKLDERQTAALLAHSGVNNALYLRTALEELRLFGRFEELTKRIQSLAEDVAQLFDQVLARLEEDHGRELVKEAFSLLRCSRYGLSEKELLDLLRRQGEEQLPRALWLSFARSAKDYLVQRGELIGFFHRQLLDAVAARYLVDEKKHSELAAYFKQSPLDRRLDEYPYQLQQGRDWPTLAATLSDLDFFIYAWNLNRKHEWMGYWRSLQGRFEPGECYQAAIEAKIKTKGETEDIAFLLNIISLFHADMVLYDSALSFNKRSLAIREKALGPDHPAVAAPLNNLAGLYHAQGKYSEAVPFFQSAIQIAEKSLGPNHPNTKIFKENLKACQEAGRKK